MIPSEKEEILKKYDSTVLHTCAFCRQILIFDWREARLGFKNMQISSQPGCVTRSDFLQVLAKYRVEIPANALSALLKAFQKGRNANIIEFDSFLKVCYLMRK
jgi:Ca2+-binding EF-hand superfamily protein